MAITEKAEVQVGFPRVQDKLRYRACSATKNKSK